MKKASKGRVYACFCFWLAFFLSNPLYAQFSNEWINFSQSYYKIPVVKNGIYKISYADLQAAGVPIASVDPRRINIFHRGTEQAIFVQGQSDAQFDPADFIEFYGQRNDGTLDADLYLPGSQPHPYYNLFSDTAAYFLTWNPLPIQGKRMSSFFEINSSSLPTQTFHNESRLEIYTNEYSGGLTSGGEIQRTVFDTGEGWTGSLICTTFGGCTGQQDFIIDNLAQGVTPAGLPQLELLLVGREEVSHQAQIYAGPNGGSLRLVGTTSFVSFNTSKLMVPLSWSDIGGNGKITVRIQLTATGTKDLVSVSYIKINFPQQYNLNSASEKYFNIFMDAFNKSYVEFLNPPSGARIWDINDIDNTGIIGSVAVAGGMGAVVPGTSSGKKLYVANTTLTTTLNKVGFRPIAPSVPRFLIISHRSLMKPALGYGDAVKAYAAYRASTAGGGYDTLTISMDQLYNQFNYGETSPRAIFQFMKYMVNGGNPKFLFLIGKGIEVSQGFYRKTSFSPSDFRDLVPSAGMPGADMAFTAGLAGTSYEPAVPTGRLTASTPTQVAGYLNKIKESEALPNDALWQKDVLHLSGGINAGEPLIFRSYVDGFKAVAESFYLGGMVETISKQTLNVELVNVKDQVNKGLNLITFFGHSGPGTIDIDIGYVSDPTLGYNNAGKYPGFLINGCNAGRFFDNRVTFGEDWMLTPNKGAKSFIAHSSYGFNSTLKQYSDIFYAVAYGDSAFMRKGIGEVQKEVGRRILAISGVSLVSIAQVQQMMLLGDPAVKLFAANKPDYEVNNGSLSIVSLDGKPVTAQSASFALDVRIRNFGRALTGAMKVRVVRTLNDNTTVNHDSIMSPVYYSSVVRFVIKKGRNNNEFGNNNFTVIIDPDRAIGELSEINNTASLNFFIPVNGTKNLFPAPYAIVHVTTLDLLFQNTDLLSESRSFKIEVDTAATFDSPFLNRKNITGKVLGKMNLNLLPVDSLVYYWRTKLNNPLPGESTDWATTSFVYINNSPEGWAQVNFPQLTEDVAVGLLKDADIKRLKFQEVISLVDVKTYGSANATPFTNVSIKINQEEFNVNSQGQSCRNNTLNLIAFDKNSTAPYVGIPFSFFDPRDCGRAPQMINSFLASELDLGNGQDLAQWVQNINLGDSVVIFSIGDAGYSSWTANVKSQMTQLGVSNGQLSGLQPGEPFVIFSKKGATPGNAKIFRTATAPANLQEVDVSKTITGRLSQGTLASVTIGPAQQWSQLVLKLTGATPNDVYGVDVMGIDLHGNETLLKSQLKGTHTLSDVDAALFPFIKLILSAKDVVDLTPVQLRKWIVTYIPMAEGMLTYAGARQPETVQEGQAWRTSYGFTNISSKIFTDSLLVRIDIFSSDQHATQQQHFKIKPPVPGDTTKFSFTVNTIGKAGSNDVTVFVNPRILPELYYENNTLSLYNHLQVEGDHSGPVLDVTVDGRHVTNGDAVSSAPTILLKVVDHNPFLLKTDTTGINLYLQYPCALRTCPYKRINFSRTDMSWISATITSDFQVTFQPVNLQPGDYVLKAEAQDASGNRSGDVPYEVSFVVKDKTGFTLQSVYPNPSSDKFYFKIIIGGLSIPEDFQLQIFSSTGQAIRNFGDETLDQLHVGTNEINVNATDAGDDPLPAGIYLFRMTSSMNGKRFTTSGRLVVAR